MNKHNKGVFRFFWECMRPYSVYFMLMLAAPILGGFYVPLTSYFIKMLIDSISVAHEVTFLNLLTPIALFVFAHLFGDILWVLSDYGELKAEPHVRKAILTNAFAYVQQHSYKYFQNSYAGTITSKLKGLINGYDNVLGSIHHNFLPPICSFIVSSIALSLANIWLGAFMIIWSIVFFVVMYKLTSKLSVYSNIASESRHNLFGLISDNILNIVSTKLFNLRNREYEKLKNKMDTDTIPKEIALYKYDMKVHIVASAFYAFLIIVILIGMIHLKNKGLVTVGDFAFVFAMLFAVIEQLWHAVLQLGTVQTNIGDLKQAFSILEDKHDMVDAADAKLLDVQKGKIEFKDVTFAYTLGKNVLENFNFKIEAGEKVGLVGVSGVGKSTITHLLLRFFEINSGKILIDGQNINDITEASLFNAISIVPQDTMLFHRTIYKNIANGNIFATKRDLENAAHLAYVEEFVKKLPNGYETVIGERGIKLSVGQRQRIAIARALLKDVPIMIFDEATSALDSVTEKYIQKTTQNIIQKSDKTMIVIAHRLSTLKNLDRIVVISDGKIVEEGKHEDLILKEDGKYSKLWKLQSDFFIF